MLKNKKGFTLVEMVATFALLLIFMSCAAACLPGYLNIETAVEERANATKLADILCETVNSELSAAVDSSAVVRGEGGEFTSMITILDEGRSVTFTNASGYTVTAKIGKKDEICKDGAGYDVDVEGLLVIQYVGIRGKVTNWFYGRQMYSGITVSGMVFTHIEDTVVIRIDLELKGLAGDIYNATRFVNCRNMASASQITTN